MIAKEEPSQEYLNERLEYKDGELYWKVVYSNRLKVGQLAGDKDGRGYRRVMIGNTHYKMHRLIWVMFNGSIPEGYIVDHEDTDITNNHKENFRLVTKAHNNFNRVNKPRGITFDKARNKWKAQISIDNRNKLLGRFDTEQEALDAYQKASKERF